MDSGSTDELEGDLSNLMDEDSQQFVPAGAPLSYGPLAPWPPHHHQQIAVDSRSVNILQMGVSETAASQWVEARTAQVAAEA